ncbi:PHP domain-containing protein [Phormidium tenue FACHB-886]|nr:PHP domain-containing protein [Phormidium tenue FACHB-886]
MLELHCHTTCSDGTLTPTQLVEAAIAAGVRVLAITDHDTMFGWDEAFTAAQRRAVEIVPGLELSTVHNERSMHILGFYPDRSKLAQPLQERLAGRQRRAQRMIEKLADLGYPIVLPQRAAMAPGRPHIAAALIKAGYIHSQQEAFERFIGEGKPAYVEYEKFSAIEGIQLLRSCGAVPVWAHPYLFRGGTVETVLPNLVAAGLMGIEVYHPSHSPSDCRTLEALCRQYSLLMTGGSDFHGSKLGEKDDRHTGLNQLQLSDELLAPLQRAAFGLRQQLVQS